MSPRQSPSADWCQYVHVDVNLLSNNSVRVCVKIYCRCIIVVSLGRFTSQIATINNCNNHTTFSSSTSKCDVCIYLVFYFLLYLSFMYFLFQSIIIYQVAQYQNEGKYVIGRATGIRGLSVYQKFIIQWYITIKQIGLRYC